MDGMGAAEAEDGRGERAQRGGAQSHHAAREAWQTRRWGEEGARPRAAGMMEVHPEANGQSARPRRAGIQSECVRQPPRQRVGGALDGATGGETGNSGRSSGGGGESSGRGTGACSGSIDRGGGVCGSISVIKARGGGGRNGRRGGGTGVCSGGDGGSSGDWYLSSIFLEQSHGRDFTHFFLQRTVKVCVGVHSPLIDPKMGREGKGPS